MPRTRGGVEVCDIRPGDRHVVTEHGLTSTVTVVTTPTRSPSGAWAWQVIDSKGFDRWVVYIEGLEQRCAHIEHEDEAAYLRSLTL